MLSTISTFQAVPESRTASLTAAPAGPATILSARALPLAGTSCDGWHLCKQDRSYRFSISTAGMANATTNRTGRPTSPPPDPRTT